MDNALQNKERISGYLALVVTAVLWSVGGLLIKLMPWSALAINGGRCFIALLTKAAVRKSVKIRFSKKVVAAGICFALTTIFFALATKNTTAANAILLQYSAPFFIMLFALVFERKRPSGGDLITSVVIIAGIALCCVDSFGGGGLLGDVFALISGIMFAAVMYINALPGADPDSANFLGLLICSLVGAPFIAQETDFSWTTLLYVFILGAFQIGLSYILLEYGIRRVSALSSTFICSLEPILNPIWVAVFYGEMIGTLAVVGGVLVIGASALHSVLELRGAKMVE